MRNRMSVSLATAAALAMTTVTLPALAGAGRDRSAVTTEFSADNNDQKDQKKQENKDNKQQQRQQHNIQQQQNQQFKQEKKVDRHEFKKEQKQEIHEFKQEKKVQQRQFEQNKKTMQIEKKEFKNSQKREFNRSGKNAVVVGANLRGVNGSARYSMHGQNYSAWHGNGGWRHRGFNGRWETFVALGALGVLAIGAYEYYPYAYIDAPQPFCEGMTEDGCQLDYQDVPTAEGYVVGQCVAYCPWQ